MSSSSQFFGRNSPFGRRRRRSSLGGFKLRLLIAGAIILFSLFTYFANSHVNPITGEKQRVGGLTPEQEIKMGLTSMPQLVRQFEGQSRNENAQRYVDYVGARLLNALQNRLAARGVQNPYPFEFHLLADDDTINAFALPGGQVFITEALFWKLDPNGPRERFESRLAGVLGHEIGHVIERHGAQRMAKGKLMQGIAMSAGAAGGDVSSAQIASAVGNLILSSNSRQHELESDRWGVELMVYAGYDPRSLHDVMDILEKASQGRAPPEILSTHPKPANRRAYIDKIIKEKFPDGVPSDLVR